MRGRTCRKHEDDKSKAAVKTTYTVGYGAANRIQRCAAGPGQEGGACAGVNMDDACRTEGTSDEDDDDTQVNQWVRPARGPGWPACRRY